jgi:hypothetical protein
MLLEHEKTIHLLCEQLQEKKDGEQSNDTQNDL